jgi:hypothetical protein
MKPEFFYAMNWIQGCRKCYCLAEGFCSAQNNKQTSFAES